MCCRWSGEPVTWSELTHPLPVERPPIIILPLGGLDDVELGEHEASQQHKNSFMCVFVCVCVWKLSTVVTR